MGIREIFPSDVLEFDHTFGFRILLIQSARKMRERAEEDNSGA